MIKKLIGLFSSYKKSTPNVEYNTPGYIISNKVYPVENLSQYIIVELENSSYNFLDLFLVFLMLIGLNKNKYTLNFLIYCKADETTKVRIKEILILLDIKNFTFIDDYNFLKEDIDIIYLDKEISITTKKILLFNMNNIYTTDLHLNLISQFLKVKDILDININFNIMSKYLNNIIPNINNATIFNIDDDHILDTFKIRALIKTNNFENITVLTTRSDIYQNLFPENTKFINIKELLNNSTFKNLDLLIFTISIFAKNFVTNINLDIAVIANLIELKLFNKNTIHYLYNYNNNNSLLDQLLTITKQITKYYEYEFVNDILSTPLTIAFFTRVTRFENLDQIYQNIVSESEKNYINYKWVLIIPYEKNFDSEKLNKFRNDKNIIIIDQYRSIDINDKYDAGLLNIALMHKDICNTQFIYVLDDDNIVHPNLIPIIRKNIDKYIIINRLDLTYTQKLDNVLVGIECPMYLDEYICVGKVDYANCVFNTTALKSIGGFNLSKGSGYSDGTTVQAFILNGFELTYSNELGGYYNKLVKEK